MIFDFIPDDSYIELPSDPQKKFLKLAKIAGSNFTKYQSAKIGDSDLKLQYVGTIRGLAKGLNIPGFDRFDGVTPNTMYDEVSSKLSTYIAQVSVQNIDNNSLDSVQLGRVTKGWIQQELEHIIKYIEESDLEESKKESLKKKIEDAILELNKQRLGFAKIMTVVAAVATAFGGTATGLAQSPKAFHSVVKILALIGGDKEKEEDEQLRLKGPSLMLEQSTKKSRDLDSN